MTLLDILPSLGHAARPRFVADPLARDCG